MATCPKCSAELQRTWTNKRRQLVGKCGECRKLVYLGRPDDGGKPVNNAETEKKKVAQPKASAAKSGGKRKTSASTHRRSIHRQPEEQPKPKSGGGILRSIVDFFNSEL